MRWLSILGLIAVYIAYLLIGAAIFYALEFTSEQNRCTTTLQELGKYDLTNFQNTERNVTVDELRSFVQLILTAAQNGVQFDSQSNPTCAYNWNYPNSFFFAGTVVTTIGYGNISPATRSGQTFCIFFAVLGLPLFAIMFTAIGEKFAWLFKKLDKKMKKKGRKTRLRKMIVLLVTCSALVLFFILIPSIIFMVVEGWTYHESLYYSFISLTTIGFGDFVAGSDPDKNYISVYRIGVYFWILFGLAFMATVISLFTDLIKGSVKKKTETEIKPDMSQDDPEVNCERESPDQTVNISTISNDKDIYK